MNLGVRFARALVPALADNFVVFDDDAAHHRVRRNGAATTFSQLERTRHVPLVLGDGFALACAHKAALVKITR